MKLIPRRLQPRSPDLLTQTGLGERQPAATKARSASEVQAGSRETKLMRGGQGPLTEGLAAATAGLNSTHWLVRRKQVSP